MKSKIKVFLLIFTMLGFVFYACNKSEDLVTQDAKTGGLVIPTSSIPYKLGATPQVNITLTIPMGPGIASIEVYNKYYGLADTTESNVVLMKTIDIASANASADLDQALTVTYADLTKDLLVEGNPLPTDELLLPIGNYWELSYVSVMADGSKIVNNAVTDIAVANIYAGNYHVVGVFHHPTAGDRPINEDKYLTPLSAYSCGVSVGDLGSAGYSMVITVDPGTNLVTFSGGVPTDIYPNLDSVASNYDPATGGFNLFYYYIGSTGNRVIDEHYTPLP